MIGTSNPILKSRYAVVLWNNSKHAKYGKISVDCFLDVIKIYETKDKENPSGHYGRELQNTAENTLSISKNIKYKIEIIKKEYIRLIKEFNDNSDSVYAVKYHLIKNVLKNKDIFKKEDIEFIPMYLQRNLRKTY